MGPERFGERNLSPVGEAMAPSRQEEAGCIRGAKRRQTVTSKAEGRQGHSTGDPRGLVVLGGFIPRVGLLLKSLGQMP